MRTTKITSGEYYHIFNRGNNKTPIFLDEKDYIRFLFLILYFQSPLIFENIGRHVAHFVRNRAFNIGEDNEEKVLRNRFVGLASFALIPNHLHLAVREQKENGISRYMQRVLCSYTKYFNARHQKVGHLFQGPYQAVHVVDNTQFLHLSAYIHRNARELRGWKNAEHTYPWSSYQDYVKENRWGLFLKKDIIAKQFSSGKEYKHFVNTSGTKE